MGERKPVRDNGTSVTGILSFPTLLAPNLHLNTSPPNPRRSIAPPIISTPKTSAHAPFPPASGLDHMGAWRHLPARRSGGSSPGVFHVVGGHRQRPRYPAGLLIHGSVPQHFGGVHAFARLLPRVDPALFSPTPSTVFCSPALMLANPPTPAAPRLLSLPRCSWDCRRSCCTYCLTGPMAAFCFRNRFGASGGLNATRTFSRCFSPRSTPRTSRCAPAISHTPTRAHRQPLVRQIADHVTLLLCDVCKTEAEAQ